MSEKEKPPRLPPHPCTPECAERTWDCRLHCPKWAAYSAIKEQWEAYGTKEFVRKSILSEFTTSGVIREQRKAHSKR